MTDLRGAATSSNMTFAELLPVLRTEILVKIDGQGVPDSVYFINLNAFSDNIERLPEKLLCIIEE